MAIADFDKQISQHLDAIRESDAIHARNKELLADYKRDETLRGLSAATILKNLSRMKQIAEHVDQPFDDMSKDDVKNIVEWVHTQDYSEETIYTYKNVVTSFWTWLAPTEDGETPPEASWITLNPPNGNGKLPTDLLTREDIQEQINAAKNPRDKALIALLWETGARIGELIDLTVGDIEDRKVRGKKVVIDGKTGPRRLPLVYSVPYLNLWLNQHPSGAKDAPLWCKVQQGTGEDRLGYRYIREKILKKTMERAGIDKPSNPHHYRHSRASHLANKFKEAQLCEWFGWVQGSDVTAKYVHLSGRDIDAAYDELHGIRDPDEEDEQPLVRECPRCGGINQPDAEYCGGCGSPLDADEAKDPQAALDRLNENLEVLTQHAQDGTLPADLEGLANRLVLIDDPEAANGLGTPDG